MICAKRRPFKVAFLFAKGGEGMNKVEPIRTKAKVDRIRSILQEQSYRNYMLFQFSIHVGMRIGDILELKVKDVRNKEFIYVTEQKTKNRRNNKRNRFTIPKHIRQELNDYIDCIGLTDEDSLFYTTNRYCEHLSRRQAYNIINAAARKAGVKGSIGCHTLRKTFGYWHYKQFKDVAMLQKIFNHTTPEETLIYIGVTDEQISNTLNNFTI